MTELTKAQQAAIAAAVKRLASVDAVTAREHALRQIFTSDQLKRISAWCKRYRTDRGFVIAGIIEAGMEAKGIISSYEKQKLYIPTHTSKARVRGVKTMDELQRKLVAEQIIEHLKLCGS